jgi:hypothetical protein
METRKGYIGMAHAQSQIGDVIALLQGASVPIILRRCESGYKVIGQSYVHGIMEGEYWNGQDEASMMEFHIKRSMLAVQGKSRVKSSKSSGTGQFSMFSNRSIEYEVPKTRH